MHMQDVKGSTQVAAVGYDESSKTLQIRFSTGAEYTYANVPPDLHKKFLAAKSMGKFLHEHIKGKKDYPHAMVKAAPKKEK